MAAPAVYLDECVHHDLVGALRTQDFTATSVRDEGALQLDNRSQLAFANDHQWVLLTYDHRDCLRLHQEFVSSRDGHSGILILPRRAAFDMRVIRAAMMLDWLGTMAAFHSQLFRWGTLQQLLISGFRLQGYADGNIALALGQTRHPPRRTDVAAD